MRKLLLFLIPLFFISVTYSQDMQVGAMGGLNLSFASASEAGMVFHGSPGVRFSLGGYMDVALPYKGLSFHPCILFSRESYTVNYEGKNPVVMSYINVPLTMLYHLESMQNKLFFGLGPYFAYGIGGKYTEGGQTTKIAWGNNEATDDAKPLDIGLNLVTGYQLTEKLILTAKFDLGLSQIDPSPDTKVHTRNFGIACGYSLWAKKASHK
jgi:hypothetical protein